MKRFLQRVGKFLAASAGHSLVTLFGFGLMAWTFLDKSFPPERVLLYQGLGLAVAGTGYMRLLDLWWGMDTNAKLLEEIEKQRAELQRMNALLEQLVTASEEVKPIQAEQK